MSVQAAPASAETVPSAERSLDIMLQVSESIASADGVDRALNRLAWLALRATNADRSAILVPDPQGPSRLLPAAGASRVGDLAVLHERFQAMEPLDAGLDLHLSALWETRRATAIHDVGATHVVPEVWKRAWQSKSIAYVPIRAGGELFGILAVDYVEEQHTFNGGELKLLEAIAGSAGVALRNAQLVERLQHVVDVERRLGECTAALRSGRTLDEMLDLVADRFASLLPDVSCAINLLSPDRESFQPVAFRGMPPRAAEIRVADLPADEVAVIEKLWEENPHLPILVDDVREHPGWEAIVPPEIGTGMLVPLVEDGQILGFVSVGRASAPFTPEEVRVASAFAEHAALALTQARLTEALHLRLKLIEALYRLGDAVARTSDLRSVLRALNREVGGQVGVVGTRVCFGDATLAELVGAPVASRHEREMIRGWRGGEREPVAVGGELAVPILLQRRPAGILWVRPTTLDANRRELVRAIAGGIGEVAYKAKLRKTSERRSQELAVAADRERIARDLHDTVGQTLFGIGLKIQDAMFDIQDEALAGRLGELRALASQGVSDVRSAVYALSFLHVRDRGFIPSLRALAQQFLRSTGVSAELRVQPNFPTLHEEVEGALYRVAHEALVNVERHARATGVVISLSAADGGVTLSIHDDGVGLDQRQAHNWQASAHFGMRMMEQAICEIGGRFHVSASSPRGLSVRARVPLRRAKGSP